MHKLDLVALDRTLRSDENSAVLRTLTEQLRRAPGPYSWEVMQATTWQRLVLRNRNAHRLHATTRRRLNHGDPGDRPRDSWLLFPGAKDLEPHLPAVLRHLHESLTDAAHGWRTEPCSAEAGFTKRVAIFPAPKLIPAGLEQLQMLRAAAPLSHPVWNALLLYLMVLRLHPFADGNGRTSRALIAYELWRAGLINESLIPLKRVLDANRATELYQLTRISRTQRDGEATVHAVSRMLVFLAKLLRIATTHSTASSIPVRREGPCSAPRRARVDGGRPLTNRAGARAQIWREAPRRAH